MDAASVIKITFTTAGHYWLSNGQLSLDLGICHDEAEVCIAVDECVATGTGEEDWRGWGAAIE